MFEVAQFKGRQGKGKYTILDTFKTFPEAHAFAIKKICEDKFHDGMGNHYYFSDNDDSNRPYQARIIEL